MGFTLPLAVISILSALFSVFYLGWGGTQRNIDLDKAMKELPEPPKGTSWLHVASRSPSSSESCLADVCGRSDMPVVGLPLAFTLSALTVIVMSPTRLPAMKILSHRRRPPAPGGNRHCGGVLVQIMVSGARV